MKQKRTLADKQRLKLSTSNAMISSRRFLLSKCHDINNNFISLFFLEVAPFRSNDMRWIRNESERKNAFLHSKKNQRNNYKDSSSYQAASDSKIVYLNSTSISI